MDLCFFVDISVQSNLSVGMVSALPTFSLEDVVVRAVPIFALVIYIHNLSACFMFSSIDIFFPMSHARWNEDDEHHRANTHQSPSRDTAKSSSSLLVVPTDLDVLCGRDQRCYNHPGNKKLRSLVSSNLLSYTTAKKRSQKSCQKVL